MRYPARDYLVLSNDWLLSLSIGLNITKQELRQNLADLTENYGEWANGLPLSDYVWRKVAYRYGRLPTSACHRPKEEQNKIGLGSEAEVKDLVWLMIYAGILTVKQESAHSNIIIRCSRAG